jgi:hypothetical protein
MKSRRIISLVIIAIAFGCGDKLNIEPFNQVDGNNAIQTSADVQALLVGAYDAMGDGDVLGGNMQRDSELLGDDGEVFWDGTFVAPGEIWVKNMLVTNDQAEETWLDAYRAINICNLVLANVDLVTAANRDLVEGEAKFIRGTLYFELVKLYAKTWTDGNPAQNPGVPLRLTPTTTSTAAEFGRKKFR